MFMAAEGRSCSIWGVAVTEPSRDATGTASLRYVRSLREKAAMGSDESRNGWPLAHLADVCEVVMGMSPKGSSYNRVGKGVALAERAKQVWPRTPRACSMDHRSQSAMW